MRPRTILAAILLVLSFSLNAQVHFDVDLVPGAEIPGTLYGIFFEDINSGADGGLYAELVKNRSFEFPTNPLQGWKVSGCLDVMADGPFAGNPHYVRMKQPDHPAKCTSLQNEGFFGMGILGGKEYRFSFWGRVSAGTSASAVRVEIVNPSADGSQAVASAIIPVSESEWTKYEAVMVPSSTVEKAELRVSLSGSECSVDIEHVSLFPVDTWKGRENGLRKDLVQALADLHPGVFRFPGGCIVEGTDLQTRYNWKNSVGPVENRPLNQNRWQYTFAERFFPDYYQSYGLGFYELFQLSEDLGAEPLPIISCGIACQFQNNDDSAHAPVDSLDVFIQDALDLVEFANGDISTTWGAVRAEMGHPEPFGLKMMGIGNEQWGSLYPERLEKFVEAFREKCPEILLVGSAGPDSEGEQFDYLWPEMRRLGVDFVDEHFYRPYDWFLSQGDRYDDYDRTGPKVFAGEYACRAGSQAVNHFRAALVEAAFMTTIERNADIVPMATYAPLFAHAEGWQWRPDLIWFDNLRVLRTTNWYVQELYSRYKGSNVLSLKQDGHNVTGDDGLFASAVSDGELVYVKVINVSGLKKKITLSFKDGNTMKCVEGVRAVKFSTGYLDEDNTFDDPQKIVPIEEPFNKKGKEISVRVEPMTFRIIVLKGQSDKKQTYK